MATTVRRTYSGHNRRRILPDTSSSPISTLSSSPPPPSLKRPLEGNSSLDNLPRPAKRNKLDNTKSKQKNLVQLHFCIDQSIFRTCRLCSMSYTKGAPDDEALHKAHCARVQKGMEWGKEEEKESTKAELTVIASDVKLKDGKKGRIIRVKADAGGKVGTKVNTLLDTINRTLSAPALSPAILKSSKVYLFLLPPSKSSKREQIAGCVVAQRISTAMAIATPAECLAACQSSSENTPPSPSPTASLVAVDTSSGVFCHPNPLPTPLGIPRLFVPSSHRRLGIASKLLTAASQTFIHGCKLDPAKGDVAFTQPTGDGNALMKSWGRGGVRIYEE